MESFKNILSQNFENFYKALQETYVNDISSEVENADKRPLTASQGKILNDRIKSLTTGMNELLVPIGYIFTWTNYVPQNGVTVTNIANAPNLTTPEAVHNYFGFGKWLRITGRFLYSGPNIGEFGGEANIVLKEENLPSHKHAVNITANTQKDGKHEHKELILKYSNDASITTDGKGSARVRGDGTNVTGAPVGSAKDVGSAHSHSVTISGETEAVGYAAAHNNMPPYINVYMWLRIA